VLSAFGPLGQILSAFALLAAVMVIATSRGEPKSRRLP
jgi:hypothetical protein